VRHRDRRPSDSARMAICYRRANRACSPHRGPCGTNRCVHRGGASGCQCVGRHLQLGVHLRPAQGRGRDRGEAPFHRVRRHRGQPPACMAGRSQVRPVRQRRERAAGTPAAGRSPDTVQGQKAFQGPAHGHALVDGHTHRVCLPHLPSNPEHGCPGQLALRHPLGAGAPEAGRAIVKLGRVAQRGELGAAGQSGQPTLLELAGTLGADAELDPGLAQGQRLLAGQPEP
jgi:hypothetical protein